jgi:hypothetical protein
MADDDNDSIQSVSPAQQCLFWSLTAAFMVKLTCLVVVAVSIHNNDWITVEPDVLRHTFVVSFKRKNISHYLSVAFLLTTVPIIWKIRAILNALNGH